MMIIKKIENYLYEKTIIMKLTSDSFQEKKSNGFISGVLKSLQPIYLSWKDLFFFLNESIFVME